MQIGVIIIGMIAADRRTAPTRVSRKEKKTLAAKNPMRISTVIDATVSIAMLRQASRNRPSVNSSA